MSSYQGNMMSYVNNMGMQNYIPPHEMVYHGQPPMPFQDSYAQNNEMYQKQNQTNEPHDYEYMLPHSTTGIGHHPPMGMSTMNPHMNIMPLPKIEDDGPIDLASFTVLKLTIGSWILKGTPKPMQQSDSFYIEAKLTYSGHRIRYEIVQPGSQKVLIIEYDFNQICGLHFKTKDQAMMIVELTEPPIFSTKEEHGKTTRVIDFTHGNATYYRRHYVEIVGNNAFVQYVDNLINSDLRLKKMAESGLTETEPTFLTTTNFCDWDKENGAVFHCEECNAKYCDECDDVLHRHPGKKHHKRVAIANAATSNKNKKRKKRKKSDRCRCGTGATKGTLGEPCTGNRCPCFSERRSCISCGCKNCNNPYNQKGSQDSQAMGSMVGHDTPSPSSADSSPNSVGSVKQSVGQIQNY